MEKQQKKQLKKYIAWVMLLGLVAVLTFLPVIAAKDTVETGPQASILSARAEYRKISDVIQGGGRLAAEKAVEITIPAGVKVKEYLVTNGEFVAEGQTVALLDRVSVMTAITQVQETLVYLAKELDDLSAQRESNKVTAPAGGTVKVIYGEPGENVQDVLLRDGALAVLSLDGLMEVRIAENSSLCAGDTVLVALKDGTQVSGRVESNLEGILTVTMEDADLPFGAEVTVTTEAGELVGSGNLEIHSPWNVVAYTGTIAQVHVKEGEAVNAGKLLLTLEDTGHTAQFESLSRQRREYENRMLELFRMYQSEAIAAPEDGMITGVDPKGTYMLSGGCGYQLELLANAPNGDDESTYVNFVGQVTEVGQDGLILRMNPMPLFLTDYLDLSQVPLDPELMTVNQVYRGDVPVYALENGEWIQLEEGTVRTGDILLFAGDMAGNFVWIVRVETAPQIPEVPETTAPTEPEETTVPGEPEEPTAPAEPEEPTGPAEPETPIIPGFPSLPGGNYPQIPGRYPGMVPEETFELYPLDTVSIANVIPQEDMMVSISVDELDISNIFPGQEVILTVDALGSEKFSGRVTGISPTGTSSGGNSKFQVEVTVEKIPNMLPGMTAHVSIVLTTIQEALCVPVAALAEMDGETVLYTGYDAKEEVFLNPVAVTVGLSDGDFVQILSGLAEGQTVCYAYYDTLVISNAADSGALPFG